WALGDEPPLQCFGSGGRQVRTDTVYGNIYDHFSLIYEYANGVRGYHNCRHWKGTYQRTKDYIYGAKGMCDVFGSKITGENKWRFAKSDSDKYNMYQQEHNELFASIRSGKPINNGEYMARSTLLGIMGRMAAYTGDLVTWDMAMNSEERLGPEK